MTLKHQIASERLPQGSDEDLLRAFLEHIPAGVYFKDRQSRFVLASRSLALRAGMNDPADLVGKTDFDIFSTEHAKQAFADEQEIIRTGKPILDLEEKETWPDGTETWVLTTKLPLLNERKQIIGTMGVSRDITERKHAQKELDQYRLRLEELVEERTADLVRLNQQLERDIAARKAAEEALGMKAQELARTNEMLENLSLIDDLTGLYNRKGFLALADHRLKLAHRQGEPFAVAFADLDGLKKINDEFGHEEGDRALIDTAGVLRESFRQSDIIARLGGDEFAVFIGEADTSQIATRIEQRLEAARASRRRPYKLAFSVGVVEGNVSEKMDIQVLLKRADESMYREKRKKHASRKIAVRTDEKLAHKRAHPGRGIQ